MTQETQNTNDMTNRPEQLEGFIGQKDAVKRIKTLVQSATQRDDTAEHIILSGPPGLGKTTLARIVSFEQGGMIHTTLGQSITKPIDLISILMRLQPKDVLFIDEIHRLPKHISETLYPAMEDYCLHITAGEGDETSTHTIPLEKFTLVGATTRPGMLPTPLMDRFGLQITLEFYSVEDLVEILKRDCKDIGLPPVEDACESIAQASRGTPRIAKKLLRRVRDYIQVHCEDFTTQNTQKALQQEGIDYDGLSQTDLKYLSFLKMNIPKPVGLKTLANSLFLSLEHIETNIEPFLILKGYITMTPRGRILTQRGQKRIKNN